MIIIRSYRKRDYDAVLALGEYFTKTPYVVDPRFRTLTDIISPLLHTKQFFNRRIRILVAYSNNKVVGFLSYIIEKDLSRFLFPYSPSKYATILFLAVDSVHQKQGVGGLLMDRCLKDCQKNEVQVVGIGTEVDNTNAVNLYLKKGFTPTLYWDAYRIYRESLNKVVLPFKPTEQDSQTWKKSIRTRPFPWFYEPTADADDVLDFLTHRTEQQIKNDKLELIQKQIGDHHLALTLQRDYNRERYYRIKGSLWSFEDFYESKNKGTYLPAFIQNVLQKLPDFVMAEYKIDSQDYETKKILQNIGMSRVYRGVFFRKDISRKYL